MIPLSEPTFNGKEWEYIKECLDTGWVSSAGKYVDLFESEISRYTNSKYAIACVNGTSALHTCLILSNVNPGDEVIVPTLTFIAPVNAINYVGAQPIFMDVDDYYNIDSKKTIEFINNETFFKNGITLNKKTGNKISAIIPVHVWGNAVYLDELVKLCGDRNINVLEDASEGLGTTYNHGKYKGKHVGTIGQFGCLSFNGNKIITTGGGGMILTNNKLLALKARYITTQAKDNSTKYIHNNIGYNYRLTNIQAALGVAQTEQLNTFLKIKMNNYNYYCREVDKIKGLSIAKTPDFSNNNHWINILKIDNNSYRLKLNDLMIKLEKNGIQTRPVWYLNHLQIPYKKYQYYKIDKAEYLVKNSLCLPSSTSLKNSDIEKIVKVLY